MITISCHRAGTAVDNESKCPVTGKRQYATQGEALATAAHQIATANAPKDLRAYRCSWCDPGTSQKISRVRKRSYLASNRCRPITLTHTHATSLPRLHRQYHLQNRRLDRLRRILLRKAIVPFAAASLQVFAGFQRHKNGRRAEIVAVLP